MDQICGMFGISRQAHYQKTWRESDREQENSMILEMVRKIRLKHARMGTRKLLDKIKPRLATAFSTPAMVIWRSCCSITFSPAWVPLAIATITFMPNVSLGYSKMSTVWIDYSSILVR